MQLLNRWREVGNRKQSGSARTRLVLTSRLVFTNATARMGFRLSPTCSTIRFGLGFPSGYLSIGILNDKGRYRQHRENGRRLKRFRRCRMRLKFQVDHSPHLGASVCFRCSALWSAQKRGQGETESVPVRLHNHGTGACKFGEDRGVPDFLCRPAERTASPRTRLH